MLLSLLALAVYNTIFVLPPVLLVAGVVEYIARFVMRPKLTIHRQPTLPGPFGPE